MMLAKNRSSPFCLIMLIAIGATAQAAPLGSAFTCQGQLMNLGAPADGLQISTPCMLVQSGETGTVCVGL